MNVYLANGVELRDYSDLLCEHEDRSRTCGAPSLQYKWIIGPEQISSIPEYRNWVNKAEKILVVACQNKIPYRIVTHPEKVASIDEKKQILGPSYNEGLIIQTLMLTKNNEPPYLIVMGGYDKLIRKDLSYKRKGPLDISVKQAKKLRFASKDQMKRLGVEYGNVSPFVDLNLVSALIFDKEVIKKSGPFDDYALDLKTSLQISSLRLGQILNELYPDKVIIADSLDN